MSDLQRTLVLVKPDGVRRGNVGEVLRRIETKGYTLVALELRTATPALLEEHYAEHAGKPFLPSLVEFMASIGESREELVESADPLVPPDRPGATYFDHHPLRHHGL